MINELRAISTFVRTAELGNLSKAAQALEISPQAASKALAQLEQHLGVRLFHRTTRSLSLTEEGQRFLENAQPSLVGLQQALNTARQVRGDVSGPLRIVGPRTVFPQIIGAVLDEFCQRHPAVYPDVQLDDRIGNWVEDRVDIGFRLGHAPQDGLIARRLFPLQLIICASPTYLRQYGVPKNLHELAAHRCSVFRSRDRRIVPWHVKVDGNVQEQPMRPAFSTNDEDFELCRVLAGAVIGQLAASTAAPYIRTGRLIPLFLESVCSPYSLYLYYGSRTAQPTRVRRFIELAVARLSDDQAFVLSAEALASAHTTGLEALV